MASIIGDALMWLLGNEDALRLLASFTIGLGILYTIIAVWKHVEDRKDVADWRDYE